MMIMKKIFFIMNLISLSLIPLSALGSALDGKVSAMVQRAIQERYPGARIVLRSFIPALSVSGEDAPVSLKKASLIQEDASGRAEFSLEGGEGVIHQGWVSFEAWIKIPTAKSKIFPGQILSADQFEARELNIASGLGREYRGILFKERQSVEGFEARQTILDGAPLLTTAMRRIPALRSGEAVRIEILSGDLKIVTSGLAQEPAELQGRVRVLTTKSKRELIGKLVDSRTVEVLL